jgi:Zn-dependent peptidase ImmA (M78 family)
LAERRLVIPETVEILGKRWTVRRVARKLISKGEMGSCSYHNRRISIAAELTESEAEETFVHELLHALLSATGDEMLGPALKEHIVELLDGPLLRLIRGLEFKEG